MQTVSLTAHYDGHQIVLDEPFELEADMALLITVLPKPLTEKAEWEQFALQNLAAAYGENEPDYSLADVKQPNPDYAGG